MAHLRHLLGQFRGKTRDGDVAVVGASAEEPSSGAGDSSSPFARFGRVGYSLNVPYDLGTFDDFERLAKVMVPYGLVVGGATWGSSHSSQKSLLHAVTPQPSMSGA